MTNIFLLNKIINDKGVKKCFIAEKMGISRQSLNQKLKGESAFNQYEIKSICEILGIDDAKDKEKIFFA